MKKYETTGKLNKSREKLIEEISSLEEKQQKSLAAKKNGEAEDSSFSKLSDLRDQLRRITS